MILNVPENGHLRQYAVLGIALIVACAIGFGAARWTAPSVATNEDEEHSETKGEEGAVLMDSNRINLAGIKLMQLAPGGLAAEVIAQGSVIAEPQAEAILAARADGIITRITKRIGDTVKAGEVIAMVESRDASTIASDRASAVAKAAAARQAFEREQRLFSAGITARQELEAAQANNAQAQAEAQRANAAAASVRVSADGRSFAIVSPIAGRITTASITLGAYVTAGSELFRVADSSRIEVQASVSAMDAQRVAAGDAAVVETAGGTRNGSVRSISASLDPRSRSAIVLITVSAGSPALQPGQAIRARIKTKAGGGTDRFSVPEEAIQTVEGQDSIFLRTADGFRAVPVTVGTRGAGRAEITSGVTPGQTVATGGAFLLKAELGKSEAEH